MTARDEAREKRLCVISITGASVGWCARRLSERRERRRKREGWVGSLRMDRIEERIVSNRVERRTPRSRNERERVSRIPFSFLRGPAGERWRRWRTRWSRRRNLYAKSVRNFISFFHGARATGGGKGKKGGRFCTRQKRRKGANSGGRRAALEKGVAILEGTQEEKKRGEAKGVDNTYPSSLLSPQRFSLLCLEHSRITLRASKQATSSQLLNVIKSTHLPPPSYHPLALPNRVDSSPPVFSSPPFILQPPIFSSDRQPRLLFAFYRSEAAFTLTSNASSLSFSLSLLERDERVALSTFNPANLFTV